MLPQLLTSLLFPVICPIEALVLPASAIDLSARALTSASPRSNTSLAHEGPDEGWCIYIELASAPRKAFLPKDIYLAGIAALTTLAVQDWNGPVQSAVFSEPAFPSPLRIHVDSITGMATAVKNAVWSVSDTVIYYTIHPQAKFEETVFSTYQDDFRILKGSWISVNRPTLPAAPTPTDGSGVNMSSVEGGSIGSPLGVASNNSLLLPVVTSSSGIPIMPSNAGTSPMRFNITVPDTTTNEQLVFAFNFDRSGTPLPPKSVYLALIASIVEFAPRPNTNRVVKETVPGRDDIVAVDLERHATDRRGRGLFVFGQAKTIPRTLATVLTQNALFVTGYVDVFNGQGEVLLATMSLVKGPLWPEQSVADGNDGVDVA